MYIPLEALYWVAEAAGVIVMALFFLGLIRRITMLEDLVKHTTFLTKMNTLMFAEHSKDYFHIHQGNEGYEMIRDDLTPEQEFSLVQFRDDLHEEAEMMGIEVEPYAKKSEGKYR